MVLATDDVRMVAHLLAWHFGQSGLRPVRSKCTRSPIRVVPR